MSDSGNRRTKRGVRVTVAIIVGLGLAAGMSTVAAADTHSASAAETRSDVGTAAAQRVTLSNGAWEPTGDDHTTFDTV